MVKLINCTMSDFNNIAKNKRIICFGAGNQFDCFCAMHSDIREKISLYGCQ